MWKIDNRPEIGKHYRFIEGGNRNGVGEKIDLSDVEVKRIFGNTIRTVCIKVKDTPSDTTFCFDEELFKKNFVLISMKGE